MKIPRRVVLQGIPATFLFSQCGSDSDNESDMIDDSRPIVLRAEATLVSNSDGEVSASSLTNSSGEPMEIHEFIFSVRPSDTTLETIDENISGISPTGGQVAIGLSVKNADDFGYALSNGPVPLWNYGQARLLGEETASQTFALVNPSPLQQLTFSTGAYLWKLDHPMYVPNGGRIVPVLKSLGAFPTNVVVGITAVGRILPSTPLKSSYKVPWVCSWVSKSWTIGQTGVDASPDNSLWNPFSKPVTIERFTGRIPMLFESTPTAPQTGSLLVMTEVSKNSYYAQNFWLTMRDSVGNPLVRKRTLFRSVFESATRTWEARHILPPGQYHRINVSKTALATPTETTLSRGSVSVASVGWREVSWSKGA